MPEYRELDVYDRPKRLLFTHADAEDGAKRAAATRVSALRAAQHALDDHVVARDPQLGEGTGSWQRYLQLPRATPTEKLVAEVFRILRVVRIAATHAQGHVAALDGLLHFSCTFNRCALAVSLTEAGAELLTAFVAYLLAAETSPYSPLYIEHMLRQYFTDIVLEIKQFADEDRVLYQFHHGTFFNRHFRYDCDNPRLRVEGDECEFSINALHQDPRLFPIDFYVMIADRLHIVPVEALKDLRLPQSQWKLWQARCSDGVSLPAEFRGRFVRQRMVVGQPMT